MLSIVTPAPLPELLATIGPDEDEAAVGESSPARLAMLLPIVGFRSSRQVIDGAQAQRAGEIAFGHARYVDMPSLVALAVLVDRRNKGFREDMVFSGAHSASAANHVYAPPEEVPGHFAMLAGALASPPAGIAAYPFALVAGYYTSALHPFIGGNGRWSRLVALQAGVAAGRPADGLMAAAFMACLNSTLAGTVWPRATDGGLHEYLSLGQRFREAMRSASAGAGVLRDVEGLHDALAPYAPSRRELERCLVRTLAADGIDLQELKTRFALSAKRAAGLTQLLVQAFPGSAPDFASLGCAGAAMKLALSSRKSSMEAMP
jgi:hypothetical protein